MPSRQKREWGGQKKFSTINPRTNIQQGSPTNGGNETYLDLIDSSCDYQSENLLTVITNCIYQLKEGFSEFDSGMLVTLIGLQSLICQKVLEAERKTTKEFVMPVAIVEEELHISCQFCEEKILQSKLSNHQKQDCKRLNLEKLTQTNPALGSKSVYRIVRQGIECSLCDIVCSTIADKISHSDSFGHITRALKANQSNTIFCVSCQEKLPNNNVQCYCHIQSKTHKRLQDSYINYRDVIYYSFLFHVRCTYCKINISDTKEVIKHHLLEHYRLRRTCSVWCKFCSNNVIVSDWETHYQKCDKLGAQNFYCQLCNEIVRGNLNFIYHVKECQGVSTVSELYHQKEFRVSLSVVNAYTDQPSTLPRDKETAETYYQLRTSIPSLEAPDTNGRQTIDCSLQPKTPLSSLITIRSPGLRSPPSALKDLDVWCNCCGCLCQDLVDHYKHSCRAMIKKTFSPIMRSLEKPHFTILKKGSRCNCCNEHLTDIAHRSNHKCQNVSDIAQTYSNAFIFCAVCQDYIPPENKMVTQHILSSEHKQFKDFKWLSDSFTYLLLFYRCRCLPCQKSFFNITHLQRHHETEHNFNTSFGVWCQSCHKIVEIYDILKHMKSEDHKQWKYREMACLICHQHITGFQNLTEHLRYCRLCFDPNIPNKPAKSLADSDLLDSSRHQSRSSSAFPLDRRDLFNQEVVKMDRPNSKFTREEDGRSHAKTSDSLRYGDAENPQSKFNYPTTTKTSPYLNYTAHLSGQNQEVSASSKHSVPAPSSTSSGVTQVTSTSSKPPYSNSGVSNVNLKSFKQPALASVSSGVTKMEPTWPSGSTYPSPSVNPGLAPAQLKKWSTKAELTSHYLNEYSTRKVEPTRSTVSVHPLLSVNPVLALVTPGVNQEVPKVKSTSSNGPTISVSESPTICYGVTNEESRSSKSSATLSQRANSRTVQNMSGASNSSSAQSANLNDLSKLSNSKSALLTNRNDLSKSPNLSSALPSYTSNLSKPSSSSSTLPPNLNDLSKESSSSASKSAQQSKLSKPSTQSTIQSKSATTNNPLYEYPAIEYEHIYRGFTFNKSAQPFEEPDLSWTLPPPHPPIPVAEPVKQCLIM